MLKTEHGHHCIFVQPDQMKRLGRLVELANALFKQQQRISVVDLLYATLWRQMSAAGFCDLPMTLTVIEKTVNPRQVFDRATADVISHTFSVTDGHLVSQSLVGLAQRIRCSLVEISNDTGYEGWLIDSLEPKVASSVDPADFGELVCSTLALPYLQRLLYKSSPQPSDAGGSLSSSGHACPGLNFGPGLDSTVNAGAVANTRLPSRVVCINTGCEELVGDSYFGMPIGKNSGSRSDATPHGVISIDMWLPIPEIDRFKLRYGDACFVDDSFFDN